MAAQAFSQPGIEVRDLHSGELDQGLRLYVKLPWRYEQSDAAYPVLLALDANRSFPIYATMSLIFETPGRPGTELIVVGVGYQTDDERLTALGQWGAWRTRDLTPVRKKAAEDWLAGVLSVVLPDGGLPIQSGGAERFLRVLRDEVIPFIDANYRTVSAHRGLGGYSDGGLFALYALFHAPELFARYFAGSPSMWGELFAYEERFAGTHSDLPARLFMTAGGREPEVVEPMRRMADRLRSRGYPGLDVSTHVFPGEGHGSGMAAAISRALCVLYDEGWRRN